MAAHLAPRERDVFLIWGGKGWIAGQLKELLQKTGKAVYSTNVRMENREGVLELLRRIKPTHVLNCAGSTGRPNVDWCEDHKEEVIRNNVVGTVNLTDCCFIENIHITVFATGCLYTYDSAHPPGGKGFTETDPPNFAGSFYSVTKAHAEALQRPYANCLILRLRMPVSDNLHPRNFVTKITSYARVVDIPNSNTILHDLLPIAVHMASEKETGVFNFTNRGAISHNEVLGMFQRIVRPGFDWKNFSEEEQGKILKAGRSNCELDTRKLEVWCERRGSSVLGVREAYEGCFRRMVGNGVK